MTTGSYERDEASGNGNELAAFEAGPLRAGATRARAREALPHPNDDAAYSGPERRESSWRSGAAATFARIRDGVKDGSLWGDHPPSLRDVRRRIHDPAYAGSHVAGWKRGVRYVLGYTGLTISLIAYAVAWPVHRTGNLWGDHPPAPRLVIQRIHDPEQAGPDRALLAVPRYVLGYTGLALMLTAYAVAWPFQSESRFLATVSSAGIFLLLHAF